MLLTIFLLSTLAPFALAFPYPQLEKRNSGASYNTSRLKNPQASLPECGPDSVRPHTTSSPAKNISPTTNHTTQVTCRCPPNSFYQTSSSYAIYPVTATTLSALTIDFHNTAWFGTSPDYVTGENGTTIGAKRYLRAELPEGKEIALITEELTELNIYEEGGFWMKFQMADAPIRYEKMGGGKGLLAGSWDILEVREVRGWAYLLWDIHVCFSDHYGESLPPTTLAGLGAVLMRK
jgi:hypothetical protein